MVDVSAAEMLERARSALGPNEYLDRDLAQAFMLAPHRPAVPMRITYSSDDAMAFVLNVAHPVRLILMSPDHPRQGSDDPQWECSLLRQDGERAIIGRARLPQYAVLTAFLEWAAQNAVAEA